MNFQIVLNQVLILFLILIAGAVAGKAGIIADSASKKLSELLLFVTSPMMVLGSFFFEYSTEKLMNGLIVLGLAIIFFFFTIIISGFLYKGYDEKVKPILRFTAVFSNCGFIGLPMMKALFGQEGVFLGSFYIVAFNLFVWTFGLAMFQGGNGKKDTIKSLKKALTTPAIICVYIGVIIFVFRVPVPDVVKKAVNYIGDMTLPLSMLIVGSLISTAKLKTIFNDIRAYYASFVRLIVIPFAAYLILHFTGLPWMPVAVVITALAMPVAANTTIFADMYDKDAVFASKAVTLSTMISIITAPLIISLL